MKIAFIETKQQQKMKSSSFLEELLSKEHNVIVILNEIYNDYYNKSEINEINSSNFDAIIFFQFIKNPSSISKINCKNIIWIPMYDCEIDRKLSKIRLFGYSLLNLKIVSFSKNLTKRFLKNGFKNILEVQYFPKSNIEKINTETSNKNILFWQRTKQINWNIVKKIIGNNQINQLTIKTNFDFGHKTNISPNKEEKNIYNINTIDNWLETNEYIQLLKNHNIFIEPREYEGIGMGFLDAMSYGIIVVSPDKPTMNEYIKDGYNGYLYDLKNPKPIDFSNINNIKNNLKIYIEENHKKWIQDQEKILKFIKNTEIKANKKLSIFYTIYGVPLEWLIIIKKYITKYFIIHRIIRIRKK